MFSIINDKIVNLDYLRYAYCHDRTTTLSGHDEYTIQLFLFDCCQSVEMKFSTEKERDDAFKLLKKEIDSYNQLKFLKNL